ncbi:helix-turn-helix transcriptional regulator [Candidatus Parcubacteria bacterium]|nr:helix-turn-helix transcriptional regulator [Candidatus Parcubacteria bacterium]
MTTTDKECPMHKTALLLSDPWTMLLMRDLLTGPRRFCDLERSLVGISTRTLTLKLKKLEEERMLKKSKEGTYVITRKGKGLAPVERAMRRYGEKYL